MFRLLDWLISFSVDNFEICKLSKLGDLNLSDASSISGTNYTDANAASLHRYYAFGNHNNLAGQPADTNLYIYDRSGNGERMSAQTAQQSYGPNKGTNIIGGTISKHSTNVSNFGSSAIYFDGTNNGGIKLPELWEREYQKDTIYNWIHRFSFIIIVVICLIV